jgi:hypothetical protein
MIRVSTTVFAAAAILASGAITQGATIDYSVTGFGPAQYPAPTTPPADAPWGSSGYPGDTVGSNPFNGTLDLTPGAQVLPIGTLTWTINYTYGGTATAWDYPADWSAVTFTVNANTNLSFGGGPAGNIAQSGVLDVEWDDDYLTLNAGTPSTFFVPGYEIVVTPQAIATTRGSNFSGSNPWVQPTQVVDATFDVTPVPEPTTLIVWSLLGGVGIAVGRWRRKRAA